MRVIKGLEHLTYKERERERAEESWDYLALSGEGLRRPYRCVFVGGVGWAGSRDKGARLFSMTLSDRTSSNRHRKLHLHLTKNSTWESPSLEVFKTQPDKALSNLL